MKSSRVAFLPLPFLAISALLAAGGCANAVDVLRDGGVDGVMAADLGADMGRDSRTDVVTASDTPDNDSGAVTCGSSVCTDGQICCSETSRCYDPRCLSCCMAAMDSGPGPDAIVATDAARVCRASAECGTGEDCIFEASGCGTTGLCRRQFACGRLSLPYCSCDGRSFDDTCAGPQFNWVHSGHCSDAGGDASGCRTTEDCTGGQICCAGTGVCYHPACLGCCMSSGAVDSGVMGTPCRGDGDCTTGLVCCTGSGRCYSPSCDACCRF